MSEQKNYIDERGNYHNVENLTLTQIHDRASEEGYRLGKAEAKPADAERNDLTYSQGFYDGFMSAKELITKELITKEPEERQGKWTPNGNNIMPWFICSACGKLAIDPYLFCPNCGARMKEGQQNE